MTTQYVLLSPINKTIVGPFEDVKEAEKVLNSINTIIYFVNQKWTMQTITIPTLDNLQAIESDLKRFYS